MPDAPPPLFEQLQTLTTEARNPRSTHIDTAPLDEVLRLIQEAPPVAMLHVEDRVERPVQVVGEAGRLPEQSVGGRPHGSPRRPSWISVRICFIAARVASVTMRGPET